MITIYQMAGAMTRGLYARTGQISGEEKRKAFVAHLIRLEPRYMMRGLAKTHVNARHWRVYMSNS